MSNSTAMRTTHGMFRDTVIAGAAVRRVSPQDPVTVSAESTLRTARGQTNAMTIDVEDYFQVSAFERYVPRAQWGTMERRVEANTDVILSLLDDAGVTATFFTLGWIAKRHPSMLRRIVAGGHEVASHGWDHVRVTTMARDAFETDVRRAKHCLEDLSGQAVTGYRAPTYSFDHRTPWAHDVLADTGHRYSSSVAPVRHDLYGMPAASRFAYPAAEGRLLEVPISTAVVAGKNRMCAGGGWFRLYPYALTRRLIGRLNHEEGQSAVFYLHPWEIDAMQPRVAGIDRRTRFRHYLNLGKVESRVGALLRDFRWDRMDRVFAADLAQLEHDAPGSVSTAVDGPAPRRSHDGDRAA